MKRKVIIFSSVALVIAGILMYALRNSSEKIETITMTKPSFQCRGKIFSEHLKFENKIKVLDIGLNEKEVEELIQYQLMFGFSNFQYMPLETPLQTVNLRTKPAINILKKEEKVYGKNLFASIKLPTFLDIKKYKWPASIEEALKAIDVSYEVEVDVDYCMKTSLASLEDFPLYFPIDPIYSYYSLKREHWGYITNKLDEKSIVLNRCQNYHQVFETDSEFSQKYWSQWNPIKRGKESHTDHYDCKEWLQEGNDYLVVKPQRTKINPLEFQINELEIKEAKDIALKFVAPLKDKKSFYEVSISEILNGKDFLYTLPNLSLDDKKLFKWLGELTLHIDSVSKIELVSKDKHLEFHFKGKLRDLNVNLKLLIGETFQQLDHCDFGITYSFDYLKDPLIASTNCSEEFFYIPQSSLMHTLFSSLNIKNRIYFLIGWPSLADESTGGYLIDFIKRRGLRSDYTISNYLEEENREDAFVSLPSFEVIHEE